MSIYDYKIPYPNGEELDLATLKGKVIIFVNTATGCGFTPHYEPLEELYKELHKDGLEIIDVPCNQFAGQTPGSDEDIHAFCTLKYNTTFKQAKKSNVNGENALPVFEYLKEKQPFKSLGKGLKAKMVGLAFKAKAEKGENPNDIRWNFTKFVVDRNGEVILRYEPTQSMDEFKKIIRDLVHK